MKQPYRFIVAASSALAYATTAIPAVAVAAPLPLPFKPAFEAGMREHLKEVAAIANNKAAPTFDNTIVAMQRAGQLL